MQWIEEVNLEEGPVPHMIAIEWYSFDQGDMRNEGGLSIVYIPAITDSKRMIDRKVKGSDSGIDCGVLAS